MVFARSLAFMEVTVGGVTVTAAYLDKANEVSARGASPSSGLSAATTPNKVSCVLISWRPALSLWNRVPQLNEKSHNLGMRCDQLRHGVG